MGPRGIFIHISSFYNHVHRLRLKKILYLELSRSFHGFLKALLDFFKYFRSETVIIKNYNGCISVFHSSSPLGYFIHISITTPIASAEKLLYIGLSRITNGYF